MIDRLNNTAAITKDSTKDVWKTYGYWAFLVGIAFFSVYPTCNWLTAQREEVYQLYFITELSIPFIPEFYWLYISLYVLFLLPPFFMDTTQLKLLGKRIILATVISGLIFIIFPTSLGFERVSPDGFYAELFSTLFMIDLPHNMAPSLHIVYSTLILIGVSESTRNSLIKTAVLLWLGLISISTLLVHQHHIIDVISAFTLVWIVSKFLIKGKTDV
jgi:membrane-associated phospholipid phosphatase